MLGWLPCRCQKMRRCKLRWRKRYGAARAHPPGCVSFLACQSSSAWPRRGMTMSRRSLQILAANPASACWGPYHAWGCVCTLPSQRFAKKGAVFVRVFVQVRIQLSVLRFRELRLYACLYKHSFQCFASGSCVCTQVLTTMQVAAGGGGGGKPHRRARRHFLSHATMP